MDLGIGLGLRQQVRRLPFSTRILATVPIGYWKLAEPSGAVAADSSGNARDAAYSNITLAQPGIGDGNTAASFNGTSSYVNLYTTGFRDAFDPDEGTIALWCKVSSAGIWSDGVTRRLAYLQADTSNRVILQRGAGVGIVAVSYIAGGTTKTTNTAASPLSTTGYFHVATTWSKAADQVKLYINGGQVGTTQTALGTWVGALASTTTLLGSGSTTPVNLHSGLEAHAAVWSRPLSAGEIANLGAV